MRGESARAEESLLKEVEGWEIGMFNPERQVGTGSEKQGSYIQDRGRTCGEKGKGYLRATKRLIQGRGKDEEN